MHTCPFGVSVVGDEAIRRRSSESVKTKEQAPTRQSSVTPALTSSSAQYSGCADGARASSPHASQAFAPSPSNIASPGVPIYT